MHWRLKRERISAPFLAQIKKAAKNKARVYGGRGRDRQPRRSASKDVENEQVEPYSSGRHTLVSVRVLCRCLSNSRAPRWRHQFLQVVARSFQLTLSKTTYMYFGYRYVSCACIYLRIVQHCVYPECGQMSSLITRCILYRSTLLPWVVGSVFVANVPVCIYLCNLLRMYISEQCVV